LALIKKTSKILAIFAILFFMMINMAGCKPKAVLLYDDSLYHFAAEALDRLNYAYTATSDWTTFNDAFQASEWDIVVVDNPNRADTTLVAEALMYDYITKGGRLAISSWMLSWDWDNALWNALGYAHAGPTEYSPRPVYKTKGPNRLWTSPLAIPDLNFAGADDNYGTNCYPGSVFGDGEILAVFDKSSPETMGALFVANDDRTILNAFKFDDGIKGGVPIDEDVDGLADSVEWWINEIRYINASCGKSVMPVAPAVQSGLGGTPVADN